MRFDRHPEFISEAERLELVRWFDVNLQLGGVLKPGLSRGRWGYGQRLTTRQQTSFVIPDVARQIFARVRALYDWPEGSRPEPTAQGDGIILVATLPGGDTYAHSDPTPLEGFDVIRLNILIQQAESGGELWLKDEQGQNTHWPIEERELHVYAASVHIHAVTTVHGQRPRYILLLSMCCPQGLWDANRIPLKT
jgi:hypothetical protein